MKQVHTAGTSRTPSPTEPREVQCRFDEMYHTFWCILPGQMISVPYGSVSEWRKADLQKICFFEINMLKFVFILLSYIPNQKENLC